MTAIASPEQVATPPPLGPRGTLRWMWRQLTSMRTALLLLFALAIAAVPGSLIPQQPVDPLAVGLFKQRYPTLSEWYERFGMFEVFSSPWFSAVYLLLMISLVGCLVPRSKVYLQAIRAKPPAAPRHLSRLPESTRFVVEASPAQVLDAAQASLRARRFRLRRAADSLAAERGYLRDTGNLVFHLALVAVLVGVGYGHLYGFRGTALVTEEAGFANTVTQYDNLRTGARFDLEALPPYSFTLVDFEARYEVEGPARGAPRDFRATIDYVAEPGKAPVREDIRVNHPLGVDGAKLFLGPHGYAPAVTVKDGDGNVVFAGTVPFLPVDPVGLSSRGVIKVPDAKPTQIGFQGFFLPSAAFDTELGPFSTFPAPLNPRLVLNAWSGDLGLDEGLPQSVYRLDTGKMTQFTAGEGAEQRPLTKSLAVGDSMELPDGLGTLTFDGYKEWVVLQVVDTPGRALALGGGIAAIVGLLGSLFVRPRRLWVRAELDEGGRTVVDVGALARSDGADLATDVEDVVESIRRDATRESVGRPAENRRQE
ncbi:MAG: cytochrome c biogenesis protein ResB [Sporichthyaceae bacterium]